MVTTALNVTEDVYSDYMRTKMYLAIREKWPGLTTKPIYVQQDNAKPHVTMKDSYIQEAGKVDEWDIRLDNQPVNSPDLNVLDLGFFNPVQALLIKTRTKNIDTLITAVQDAFRDMNDMKLTDKFVTLQTVMKRVIEEDGGIDFLIPHLRKGHMRHIGKEISGVHPPRQILNQGDEFLRKHEDRQVE